jgi:hypothetical protein
VRDTFFAALGVSGGAGHEGEGHGGSAGDAAGAASAGAPAAGGPAAKRGVLKKPGSGLGGSSGPAGSAGGGDRPASAQLIVLGLCHSCYTRLLEVSVEPPEEALRRH